MPDIFSIWEKAGLAEPVIEEHFGEDGPNKTVVILPLVLKNQVLFEKRPEKGPEKNPHKKADDIEKRIMQVYELIAINPSISRPEIGQQLNISLKQTRIAVDALKERGIIEAFGNTGSLNLLIYCISQQKSCVLQHDCRFLVLKNRYR